MHLLIRSLVAASVVLLSAHAMAQWQWRDRGGQIVFSDRAPPADIPEQNILKNPKRRGIALTPMPASSATPEEETAATASVEAPASDVQMPIDAEEPKIDSTEKELAEKKKKAEAEEAQKIQAEKDEIAKAKAENCERAQRAKVALNSGIRITRTNINGEREFLDDAQREAELKRTETIISNDCS